MKKYNRRDILRYMGAFSAIGAFSYPLTASSKNSQANVVIIGGGRSKERRVGEKYRGW